LVAHGHRRPRQPGPYEKAFTDALGKYADGYMSCVPWNNPTKKRARGSRTGSTRNGDR
jgi:hypothetical protein